MAVLVLTLILCGLLTAERTSRVATLSYAAIYFSGTLLFALMGLDKRMPFESYLLAMATMSACQIAIYAKLQARPAIIAAMACEVLLLATYLIAYARAPEFLANRVAIWQGINFVAIVALMGDWWRHGITRLDRRHKWLRGFGAAHRAARVRGVVARKPSVGMGPEALP